jgi:catalase-peroxidase
VVDDSAWEPDDGTLGPAEVWNPHAVANPDEMVSRRTLAWSERRRGLRPAEWRVREALSASATEGYSNGDPLGSTRDICVTFTRMAMNVEENGGISRRWPRSVRATARYPHPTSDHRSPIESMGRVGTTGGYRRSALRSNGIEGSWAEPDTVGQHPSEPARTTTDQKKPGSALR